MSKNQIEKWLKSGVPYIWFSAGMVSISVILVIGLILIIAANALPHFWPTQVVAFDYLESQNTPKIPFIAEFREHDTTSKEGHSKIVSRYLIKTANRDVYGLDFRWINADNITNQEHKQDIVIIERRQWGDFYGYLDEIRVDGQTISMGSKSWSILQDLMNDIKPLIAESKSIKKNVIGDINYKMEKIRLKKRSLALKDITHDLDKQQADLEQQYDHHVAQLAKLHDQLAKKIIVVRTANNIIKEIPIDEIIRAYKPNTMSLLDNIVFCFAKLWEFIATDPREANTEGGIFPAIFGTVMMVMLMSVIVTPFGIITAIYLHEYAKQGLLTKLIRVAVNNLAGVPSVVYGVFGLGFFVYFLGGSIDQLFFPEKLPSPTYGTPGILWASLTLAILTVPVVIVATEEGLARVPRNLHEGSLALGATKLETLWHIVLPMTTSSMMTGLILAVSRAAGEVAPLMLVGVVKLAPSLPLDGQPPFLHLERKFMHLGFHIYDVGFQSPNVEAARPLVYATALLLIVLIIGLNMTAIKIRNNLREKYLVSE